MGRVHPKKLLTLLACLVLGGGLIAQEPVFRVKVRLVRLLVSVKDNYGKPISSLEKNDFTILDDGVRQDLTLFERHTEQPLSISMLVDTSGSTAKDLRYETDSVNTFFHALFSEGNENDAVSLYSFNYQVTLEAGFTRRLPRLDSALRGLRAEGGTSMYDALCFAAQRLESREGRHAIIIVTDGGDTTSVYRFLNAVESVQRADAVVYPILVMPITNDAGRNIGGENALTSMAQDTGGRVFAPSVGPDLDDAFREILKDLRTQYLLGYYPKSVPRKKDPFHRLDVTVAKRGLHVLSRNGYYEDSDDSSH